MHTFGVCFTMLVGMRPSGTAEQLEKRRRQAITLLRAGTPYREVARLVRAAVSSVVRWQQAYRRDRRNGLRARPTPGRPSRLTETQKARLRRLLLQGARAAGHTTELWTLKRIGTLIEAEFDVRYSSVGVWKLLRHGLNWSWQKPERRARQRDEAAIDQWKTTTWPHIKKRRPTWGPPRVSR
jgi:transposase